jgi:hypothetical protein
VFSSLEGGPAQLDLHGILLKPYPGLVNPK